MRLTPDMKKIICNRKTFNVGKAPHVKGSKKRKQLSNMFVRYGIPYEDGAKLVEYLENGTCVLCKKQKRLLIDHNHETGKVRGYLCPQCNAAIGFFNDDVRMLQRAIAYLRGRLK